MTGPAPRAEEPPARPPTFASLARDYAIAAISRALTRAGGVADSGAELTAQAFGDAQRAVLEAPIAPELTGVDVTVGLDDDSRCLIAFLVAAEFEADVSELLVALTGDRERCRLEVGQLPHLLDLPLTMAAPSHPLIRTGLLQVGPQLMASRVTVQVAPRLAWALSGDDTPDQGIETRFSFRMGDPDALPRHSRVLVSGGDAMRRCQHGLHALGVRGALVTEAPVTDLGWASVVREASVQGLALMVETDGPLTVLGARWVERALPVPVALLSPLGLPLDTLPHAPWREVQASSDLPGAEEWAFTVGEQVTPRHPLTARQLDLMRRALEITAGDEDAAYRRLTDARMDMLATKIVPRNTWTDLVLSPGRTGQLQDLVNRYRHAATVYDEWGFSASPSRGVVALFSGPSGTGKTLSAEVVAGELGLDLYRLDLSSVVSKYIGETQKNLDELFDAASIGNTVLFFDEADSLFGKRTEVSDARDRYANVETSYLLQRLERYDGLVIMATNYEKNIDQAFLRRVHTRVAFAAPTAEERRELWRHNLHRGVELAEDVDLDWLVATFELTGAAIRNAVVDAAFLAAAEGDGLAMRHLVRGVAREMGKVGRVLNASQFGRWHEDAMAHTASV